MKYILKNKKTGLYLRCASIGTYGKYYFNTYDFYQAEIFTDKVPYIEDYVLIKYDEEQIIYIKKQRKKKLEKIRKLLI